MAYGKIHDTFWDDAKLRSMSEAARLLMAYLITCRHKNRLGCYVLDFGYVASDLRWDQAKVEATITELITANRIAYDFDQRVVFVKNFLKHNVMENAKVVTGAVSELASVPDTQLFVPLLEKVEQYKRPHYAAVLQALSNRIANSSANDIDTVSQTIDDTNTHIVAPPIRSRSVAVPEPEPYSVDKSTGDRSPESFPQNGNGKHGDMTDGQIMKLIRQRFYIDDGKPPPGWDEGREFGIMAALRERGHTGNQIALAVEGAALIRDADGQVGDQKVKWVKRGEKMTMRVLYNTAEGVRPLWSLAEQKVNESTKPAEHDQPRAGNAETIGDVLKRIRELVGDEC